MIKTICFATNNPNKLAEVRNLLEGKIELVGLQDLHYPEELAEDFSTLEENARQKAEFVFQKFGIACFADDTGLEVKALSGAPGVLSARYAGDQKNSRDNIALLLKNLKSQPERKAQFRTVICLYQADAEINFFEGKLEGKIINELRGNDGFGYDPVFVPSGFNRTLAEMSLVEKNAISHRARAVNQLVKYLLK